jgi:rhodanese-related sulfurtransferase
VKAPKTARLAVQKGYTNVHLFQEGIEGWVQKGYPVVTREKLPTFDGRVLSPGELTESLAKDTTILMVDIRDKDLYDTIRLRGGEVFHFRLVDLEASTDRLAKDRPLVIIDHLGNQAKPAGAILKRAGFNVIGVLEGGIMAWQKAGFAVEQGRAN